MNPLFSVVILNWNSLECLQKCLDALRKQTFRSFEVICVDNGSQDGSPAWLKTIDISALIGVNASILWNEANTGFAAGMNQGIRVARGEWIMPLNVDVFLAEDFLEQALREIEAHPGCDMLGPKIYRYADGKTEDVICTGVSPTVHMSVITDVTAPDGEYEVFGPAGCCPLISRQALEAAELDASWNENGLSQYYDEVYFAYGEDVDLYLRLHLLGFTCIYSSSLKAWHVHSGTQDGVRWFTKSPATLKRLAANAVFTWLKNCVGMMLWANMARMVFIPAAMSAVLLCKRPTAAIFPLLAYGRIIRYLPRTLRIRKLLQQGRKITSEEFRRLFRR